MKEKQFYIYKRKFKLIFPVAISFPMEIPESFIKNK